MRSIGLARVGGVTRMVLNGSFVFQSGVLDQGYWPDGLYSAPTDEALRFDLELARRLGFNMVRKHVKVEPQRWYYWADRLGVLVWQDMPNMPIYLLSDGEDRAQFETELGAMIDGLRSHPSIVAWVPFNEGWGQFDVERVVAAVKQRDPSRMVSGNSGSANCCQAIAPMATDLIDAHLYSGPYAPAPDPQRASVSTEFGTCEGRNPEHEWAPGQPSGRPDPSPEANEGLLRRQWDALQQQMRWPGLSAAVYVELYDIEQELAGLYTYDRRVDKCGADLVRELNRQLLEASRDPAATEPQAGAVPTGMIGYWSFDEAAGDRVADLSGAGNDLILAGGAAAVDGVRGRALDLRGAGPQAAAVGPVIDTTGSFTVAAWLRHWDEKQTAAAISQAGDRVAGFQLGLRNGDERADLGPALIQFPPAPGIYPPWRWTFDVPDQTGCLSDECGRRANSSYGDGGLGPPIGTWQHVIGVVDRGTRSISLYIDGVHITTEQADDEWDADGVFGLGIAPRGVAATGFNGTVDELRVFDRALSAPAAWQLYAAEVSRSDGQFCVGDCDGNRRVAIDELVGMLGVALGGTPADGCNAGDVDRDGRITIDELLAAVRNALAGCTA